MNIAGGSCGVLTAATQNVVRGLAPWHHPDAC